MSSFSHATYTSRWATSNGRFAVFSIDYGLAPEHRFPTGINDVWQAYVWIITNCKSYFGIDYKKVILCGDSAGGNLAIGVTTMSINRNFRKPDRCMLIYPSTITCIDHYWPSLLSAMDDPLLSATFLNLISRNYLPKSDDMRNKHGHGCYASPTLGATDHTLSQMPKTHVILGGVDPLKDEAIYFCSRCIEAGVDL